MRAFVTWVTETDSGHDVWEDADSLFLINGNIHVIDSGQELRYVRNNFTGLTAGIYAEEVEHV